MGLAEISQLVLQIGLPTVGCIALAIFIKTLYKDYREDIKTLLSQQNELNTELQGKYDARIEKITETITDITREYNTKITDMSVVLQQNTSAIEKLTLELDNKKER